LIKSLVPIGLLAAACLVDPNPGRADAILSVKGHIVKWPSEAAGRATAVTYALLTAPFSLPRHKNILSPDNCGAMRPFSEITSATAGASEILVTHELRSAFEAWEKVAGITFTQIVEPDRADLILGAADGALGPAFANLRLSGSKAIDPPAKPLGARIDDRLMDLPDTAKDRPVTVIEQAYVCLNPKVPWKIGFDGNLHVFDLRYTFMHEIGHAIGLDHPGRSGSIMGYRYDERVRALQASDIASAQWLYGPPAVK
jgi:hypothetical protein